MSLSVCSLVRGAPDRLLRELVRLKPHVEEIVVGVDSRSSRAALQACAEVADRVLPFDYARPTGRQLGWLYAQCSSRWILRLDADEIIGESLIHALPALLDASDVTHYWLPCRWLFPNPGTYLAERPWSPDYQLRIARNEPYLLRFPGELHFQIVVLGPGRYLDDPFYHADCVLNDREERERKAAEYELIRPGLIAAGRPMNHSYYVPEARPNARTAPVAAEDQPAITAFLAPCADAEPDLTGNEVPAPASRAEIDRFWEGRTLQASAYRAQLEIVEEPLAMYVGEVSRVAVRVANHGDDVWPWGMDSRPEIRLSYRWFDDQGTPVDAHEYLRSPFPASVPPGSVTVVLAHVTPPNEPGRYLLELDLVHEHVRWFDCAVRASVDVRAAGS